MNNRALLRVMVIEGSHLATIGYSNNFDLHPLPYPPSLSSSASNAPPFCGTTLIVIDIDVNYEYFLFTHGGSALRYFTFRLLGIFQKEIELES